MAATMGPIRWLSDVMLTPQSELSAAGSFLYRKSVAVVAAIAGPLKCLKDIASFLGDIKMGCDPASGRKLHQSLLLIVFVVSTDPESLLCQLPPPLTPAHCHWERHLFSLDDGTQSLAHSENQDDSMFIKCQHNEHALDRWERELSGVVFLRRIWEDVASKWGGSWYYLLAMDVCFVIVIKYLVFADNYDFSPLAEDVIMEQGRRQKKVRSAPATPWGARPGTLYRVNGFRGLR